jgi:hypothetical protein
MTCKPLCRHESTLEAVLFSHTVASSTSIMLHQDTGKAISALSSFKAMMAPSHSPIVASGPVAPLPPPSRSLQWPPEDPANWPVQPFPGHAHFTSGASGESGRFYCACGASSPATVSSQLPPQHLPQLPPQLPPLLPLLIPPTIPPTSPPQLPPTVLVNTTTSTRKSKRAPKRAKGQHTNAAIQEGLPKDLPAGQPQRYYGCKGAPDDAQSLVKRISPHVRNL